VPAALPGAVMSQTVLLLVAVVWTACAVLARARAALVAKEWATMAWEAGTGLPALAPAASAWTALAGAAKAEAALPPAALAPLAAWVRGAQGRAVRAWLA
jgi:hypothetical protein